MRIRGLVKASHKVRDQLKIGIPPNEVLQFKQYVSGAIQATEQICAKAKINPRHLPLPSRHAYQFLRGVDLNNLPISEHSSSLQSQKQIRIRRIRSQQQQLQQKIAQVATARCQTQQQALAAELRQTAGAIELLCQQQGATPNNLTGQSRQIYCWLKFLLQEDLLHWHVRAVYQLHAQMHQVLSQHKIDPNIKQLGDLQQLRIEFDHMASLYCCRFGSEKGTIRINEGFILAQPSVQQAILEAILLGKTPARMSIVKEYSLSEEFAEILLSIELMVDELGDAAQGGSYNLNQIFETVNRTYFGGGLDKPKLCWSRVYSKRKFGHYEPSRDLVVLSLNLDVKNIPRYVVEFVMYHELLHKVHGGHHQNGRRFVHTPEFRADECQFKQYAKAQKHLSRLANSA